MTKKGVGAAAFIVDQQGQVLLVKHTYGHLNWELPGGGAEDHESPMDTAIREVLEETGLVVAASHMTGCYYAPDNDSVHFVFQCHRENAETVPLPDRREISECRFWSPTALPRPISDWTIQRIQDADIGRQCDLPTIIGERVWF